MFSSNRVSIKADLVPYIESIASDVGLTELADVIALIVLDHKRGFCQPFCKAGADAKPGSEHQVSVQAIADPTEGLGELF
ncbi:hypothetical protein H6F89_27100 [Cyanobacteria bacterium FACHB-63]|nr:hypothetical protein [Cyanobacteria bacterium FACHB-63]